MKFIKLISLVALLVICGTSQLFAQVNKPYNPDALIKLVDPSELKDFMKLVDPSQLDDLMKAYPYVDHGREYIYADPERYFLTLTEEQPALKNLKEQLPLPLVNLYVDILDDVYITVFGVFSGEDKFFDQYPYDTDFPEGVQSGFVCNPSFWKSLDSSNLHHLSPIFTQFGDNNIICGPDTRNSFALIHRTALRNQSEVDAFVIPLKGIRRSRSALRRAISKAQDSLDTNGDEYTTALEIRSLIEEEL